MDHPHRNHAEELKMKKQSEVNPVTTPSLCCKPAKKVYFDRTEADISQPKVREPSPTDVLSARMVEVRDAGLKLLFALCSARRSSLSAVSQSEPSPVFRASIFLRYMSGWPRSSGGRRGERSSSDGSRIFGFGVGEVKDVSINGLSGGDMC